MNKTTIICWVLVPVLVALGAGYAQYSYNTWQLLDLTKKVYNHYPGPCRVVEGVEYGAEKVVTLPNGLALMSSGIQLRGRNMTWADGKGAVYMFDFNAPWNNVTQMSFSSNYDYDKFNPHGIAFYENPRTGRLSLFLVNHHPKGDRIEVFDVDFANQRLMFRKHFMHPLIYNINDIAPTGENSFYATIDQYSVTPRGNFWEMFGFLKWGRLIHFNGNDATVVAEGLNYPNGVAITRDKRFLYVAEFLGQTIQVYEVQKDFTLKHQRTIDVWTHLDNIEIDHATGDLWLGCHPVLYRIFKMNKGPIAPPSQVLRVIYDPVTDSKPELNEVFMDDGMLIMGASAASHWRNKLLVGGVFERLVYCDIITPYQGNDIVDRWTI